MYMACYCTEHVLALMLSRMQAPPMLSTNATRSKSLAPLPVSTAASSGAPLAYPVTRAFLRSCNSLWQLLLSHYSENDAHLHGGKMRIVRFAHAASLAPVQRDLCAAPVTAGASQMLRTDCSLRDLVHCRPRGFEAHSYPPD